MQINEFKKIGRLLKEAYKELELEAISQNIDIFGEEYKSLMDKTRDAVLAKMGFTLEEYREVKNSMEKERVSKVLEEKVSPQIEELKKSILEVDAKIPEVREPTWDALKDKPKLLTLEEVREVVEERVSKIPKPKEKQPLIKIERPVTQVTERVEYDDKLIKNELKLVKQQVEDIIIPDPLDEERFREELKKEWWELFEHNIDILGMPDFRKLAMGLQAQIDEVRASNSDDISGPSGSTTQVQFNDSGSFAGDSNFTYNKTLDNLYVGTISQILPSTLTRNASGYVTSKAYTGGKTLTYTRDANNFITSKTDATKTWTYTRNASNQITSVAVA